MRYSGYEFVNQILNKYKAHVDIRGEINYNYILGMVYDFFGTSYIINGEEWRSYSFSPSFLADMTSNYARVKKISCVALTVRKVFEIAGKSSIDYEWFSTWFRRFIYSLEFSDSFTWKEFCDDDPKVMNKPKLNEYAESPYFSDNQSRFINICLYELKNKLRGE